MSVIKKSKLNHQYNWSEIPTTTQDWFARADQVADILVQDVIVRDKKGNKPLEEIQLLKDSGLIVLLAPKKWGGGEQKWDVAYKVIRILARKDASIAQLLGYHYLISWTVRLIGTEQQIDTIEELYSSNRYIFGSAVNPRDADLEIIDLGERIVYNGDKFFSTGARTSDLLVLEGVLKGTDSHIFTVVRSNNPGLSYGDDWDHLGQRLSESGSTHVRNVEVNWTEALGFVDKQFINPTAYNTLNYPALEQVFSNLYLGSAEGALEAAAAYTKEKTRAWPYGGYPTEKGTDEWYIREGYGALYAKLIAVEALIDKIDEKLSTILHADREKLTATERGAIAVLIASGKINAVEVGLEISNKIFELTGARATSNKLGFDIYWRNIRTHSLHDPLPYKKWEVGSYVLLEEIPAPTWYT